jgi:aminopeptidase N
VTLTAAAAPGAAGAGDRLFPGLGNGGYDVQHYTLNFRYATSAPRQDVRGNAAIDALATQELSSLNLDYAGDAVTRVTVNASAARYRRRGKELIVTPREPIAQGARFRVRVAFRARPSRNWGVDRAWFASPSGSFTEPQPNGAHRIFPSNDHPSDLATYTIKANTPAGATFIANGERQQRRTRRGRTSWIYQMREPMASELIQLAFGRLRVRNRGLHAGVRVRDVATPGELPRIDSTLARVRDHLDYMVANAGPYPFRSYGTLVSDSRLPFALETQTLSLFGVLQGNLRSWEPIMVHELAHQWYGNSVVPARWSDLWLSEGHATWFQWTWMQERDNFDMVRHIRRVYEAGDLLRDRYGPIAQPRFGARDIGSLYSAMVYDGAATALYALRQEIGDAAFRALLREWPRRYAHRAVTTQDYIALASEIAGRDLSAFLNTWLYGLEQPPMPGHPTWTVRR